MQAFILHSYRCLILLTSILCLTLSSCTQKKKNPDEIVVGTIAGPETELMEVIQKLAWQEQQLAIRIVTFTDFVTPNLALADGSLDANAYQHLPYLEETTKSRGLELSAIGHTFVYPLAAYSQKLRKLDDLQPKASVAIPNDPSNEGRALLLLHRVGLIELKKFVSHSPSLQDIAANPKQLQLIPIEAAQLPRALADVDLAIINTVFAAAAKLNPKKDGLFCEDGDSPYANVIAVRSSDKDKEWTKKLLQAVQHPLVAKAAGEIFAGNAIPAWR